MKKTIEGFMSQALLEKDEWGIVYSKTKYLPDDTPVTITYEVPDKKYSVTAEEIESLRAAYPYDRNASERFIDFIKRKLNQEGK